MIIKMKKDKKYQTISFDDALLIADEGEGNKLKFSNDDDEMKFFSFLDLYYDKVDELSERLDSIDIEDLDNYNNLSEQLFKIKPYLDVFHELIAIEKKIDNILK